MASRELRFRGWGKVQGAGLRLAAALAVSLTFAGMSAQTVDPGAADTSDPAAVDGAPPAAGPQAGDPPSRVVRLSLLQGDVSVEPGSVNQFSAAEANQVLTSGDRVYAAPSSYAEMETGQILVRLGGGADVTVAAMTDQLAQFGLAAGSMHLRSFAIEPGTVLEIDSLEASVTVLQPGDVRVDEDAAAHVTTISVLSGQVEVDGSGISQQMNAQDRLRIHAADPSTGQAAYAEPLPPGDADALDGFSDARDTAYTNGLGGSSDYVNPEATGAADLAGFGSWDTSGDFGAVWFPVVTVGWRPYCYGHWAWVAPWGWTWVGAEPWGFAPFHYGRWVEVNGRWGWLPGTRANKPVYGPAMVAFVGAKQISTPVGNGPAAGVTAWFPLGPREPYEPWYHGSTLYLNRVNASNLYDPNPLEARAFFNQRAVNVYLSAPASSRVYVNRPAGTVVVPEASFAAGQPVARNQIRLLQAQLAQAPVLAHPQVLPERSMVVHAAPGAVPPQTRRPDLAVREGAEIPAALAYTNRPAFVHARTAPPEIRPSFEQQRRAMEHSEPGRPIEPAQLNVLRPSRPAVQPGGGHEPAAHPAAAPARAAESPKAAPAPAPAPSSPHR